MKKILCFILSISCMLLVYRVYAADEGSTAPTAGTGTTQLKAETEMQALMHKRHQERMVELTEALKLSDEQRTQVDTILLDDMAQKQAILEKYKGEQGPFKMRSLKNEIEAVNIQTVEALNDVLNPRQLEQYQVWQKQKQAQMREEFRTYMNP